MHFGARIVPIDHTASVPKSPSRRRCRAGDSGGGSLEEIVLVGWVFVDSAADEGEEGEEETATDEDERDQG